jgi:hypothetical protein
MRIHNCLMITSDDSCIEVKPHEFRHFSGNLIVNEAFLANWSEAISRWRGVAKALADMDTSRADDGRRPVHDEVVS